jgi:hypothetical protein
MPGVPQPSDDQRPQFDPLADDPRLAAALAGRAALDLRSVLGVARERLRGSKRVLLVALLAWLAVSWIVGVVTWVLGLGELASASVGIVATAPLSLGLTMMGARRAAGHPAELATLGRYLGATGHAAVVLLLALLVLTAAEALLGPVLSLVLVVAYSLLTSQALFLVADRRMDALAAVAASVRTVRHVLPTVLVLHLALAALLLLAALPFGLGLIWAAPFAVIALGAVSVSLFGVRSDPPLDERA